MEVLSSVKVTFTGYLGRIDDVTFPNELGGMVIGLRNKLSSDRPPSQQVVFGELGALVYQFNNRLLSAVPELASPFPWSGSGSPRLDMIRDLFSDAQSQFPGFTIELSPIIVPSDSPVTESVKNDVTSKLGEISAGTFDQKRGVLRAYVKVKLEELLRKEAARKAESDSLQQELRLLYSVLEKKKKAQSQIDEALVTYGIPAIAITMIILMLTPMFYDKDRSQEYILNSGLLIQIFTIFLLTSTILVLGFAGKIESNSLGTLLGGISGYVLGRNIANEVSAKGHGG